MSDDVAQYIEAHPDTVQHLVNAFVRAMRFINSHRLDEIVAKLPPDYFRGKDREAEIKLIRDTMSTHAKGDYHLVRRREHGRAENMGSAFDESEEGRWRAGGNGKVDPAELYTNRFINVAMKAIP